MPTRLKTPWLDLPKRPPYVIPQDRPYVEAFNKHADNRTKLRLRLLPDPFIGRSDAPLVVLMLNPGFTPIDHWQYRIPERRRLIMSSLMRGDGQRMHYLDDAFATTPGGRWWRRSLGSLLSVGFDYSTLSEKVLAVEFHGYHSRSFASLPITLPSQWFGFQLVSVAMERGATIVVARGWRYWDIAVPGLSDYRRRVRLSNARASAISPGNCTRREYALVLEALEA